MSFSSSSAVGAGAGVGTGVGAGVDPTYDSRVLERLELPAIIERLERECACSLGRELARELRPSNSNRRARAAQSLTSQAHRFASEVREPSFGGLSDVREPVRRAAIGSVLDAVELLAVGRAASGVRRLRESLVDLDPALEGQFPGLEDLAEGLFPRLDLEKAVEAAIDDNGEVRDEASLDLLRARRALRSAQAQVQTRLRQMLADPRVQSHLQDAFVTVRDGRYCLPVKAESRASVPGIVHDRSGSGAAVFVEPQEVVDLNNRLRELKNDEKAAIEALLRELSARVGDAAGELSRSLEAAAELDFCFARAALSRRMDACEPLLRDDASGFCLLGARHPLVEGCVANDILLGDESSQTAPARAAATRAGDEFEDSGDGDAARAGQGGDFDVMMLTGPNTGGKTVVLKTLGLLTAMAGCGLHIPSRPGSWLSLPGALHVDIGDEQSIEQSLSTFSGHLRNIVGILRGVAPGDLVLFDEIGAGTDPDEGAALAKAVLRALARRGARVVATTHYGELKSFALSARRFANASVEFDPVSLAPTYRLRIGVPGASNALDIAARLGMPEEIVTRARKYLGAERVESEAANQRLEETQRALDASLEEAHLERQELEKLRLDFQKRLARLERERETELEAARERARQTIDSAAREADEALRELRRAARAGAENRDTERARGRLRALREGMGTTADLRLDAIQGNDQDAPVRAQRQSERPRQGDQEHQRDQQRDQKLRASGEKAARRAGQAASPSRDKSAAQESYRPIVGDMVSVRGLDREGEVLRVEGERVEVRVGAMKVQVSARDLTRARARVDSGAGAAIALRKSWGVADELNVIGQSAEEARAEVEKYLDDALLAGLNEVRIVHGRGTGALKNAIHRLLRAWGDRLDFSLAPANQGGDGATVVRLGPSR